MPAVEGVEHRYLDAGFLRMHVAEAGPPDGDPVVLLHGWPQHWYMWRNQIGPLAERYRVIVPDLRGFGWTEAPLWGYEKQQFAADVLALLDALGLERVKLAGHDWGGFAGFLLCLRHPERVERFVALNTGGPWASRELSTLASSWRFLYMAALASPLIGWRLAGRARALLHPLRNWVPGHGIPWAPADQAIFLDQFREPARARATMLTYRAFLTRELPRIMRGRLEHRRLFTPTLFLHGTEDPVLKPDVVRVCERHADDLTLELIEGIGHFSAEEAADTVTARMLQFFGAGEPARAPRPVKEAAA
ncbi:MAG: alpha/beta hydrolase [Thermoleophilaceae bacterium]|nr:alpha/beta hydrolase [Thermoleophilaceae bacterium]